MVYCTKCGTENSDDAVNCKKCGSPLNATPYREYRRYGWDGDMHFRRHGSIWGIMIGLFIMMIGASSLLGVDIWDKIWPAFIILIGLIIVVNSYTRHR
ncbi:MAG: zinc-ribbon domain-containing protein [Candidatus Bathyarchaeota archaeon]|nr:zinc-ribbon domain-containing protein [Candidatus Bathyarchaeota archaeon]